MADAYAGIDDATRKLLEQYMQLAQQAQGVQAGFNQQAAQAGQTALGNYQGAAQQGVNDLRNQGFDSSGLQANALMNAGNIGNISENFNKLYASEDSNLQNLLTSGAYDTGALNTNYHNQADLAAADAAFGGGGGGGYGGGGRSYGGGSGGGDVPTAGDATNIAKALAVLPSVTTGAGRTMRAPKPNMLLDAFLNGTGGEGIKTAAGQEILPANFGHVSGGGGHANLLANKYMQQYDKLVKQGIISDSSDMRDKFFTNLKGEAKTVNQGAGKRQTAANTRRTATLAANLRGYDVGPDGEPQDNFDWDAVRGAKSNLDAYLAAVGGPGPQAKADPRVQAKANKNNNAKPKPKAQMPSPYGPSLAAKIKGKK